MFKAVPQSANGTTGRYMESNWTNFLYNSSCIVHLNQ